MKKKNKWGFSLVEVILTIGFIAVAIVTTLYAYNQATAQSQANEEAQFVAELKDSIFNAYIITGQTKLSTQEMIDAKLVPGGEDRICGSKICGRTSGYKGRTPFIDVNQAQSTGRTFGNGNFIRITYNYVFLLKKALINNALILKLKYIII